MESGAGNRITAGEEEMKVKRGDAKCFYSEPQNEKIPKPLILTNLTYGTSGHTWQVYVNGCKLVKTHVYLSFLPV